MTDEEILNHNGLDSSPGSTLQEDCSNGNINNNNINNKLESAGLNGLQAVPPGSTKYTQLLSVIEEMSKDLRPTYASSKTSTERLKKGIVHARILVRECLVETERSAQQ